MKILYNLASLKMPKTGIGHYTQHLIIGMLRHEKITGIIGVNNKKIWTRDDLLNLSSEATSSCSSLLGSLKKWLWPRLRALPGAYQCRFFLQGWLSASARTSFAQQGFIYHETNFIPHAYVGKLVISVHDLSHIRYPDYHPKPRVRHLNRKLAKALHRADKIITGSEFTRQELLAYFTIDPNKIVTVLDGVDGQFEPRNLQQTAQVLNKYNLKHGEYLLSVCTLEPRKNLLRLLKAFCLLPDEFRQAYPMVLVGGKGWGNKELLRVVTPLIASAELILTGYVPQADLPYLYAGAKIFAYPSLYEGFGLPVLEAMASGVPVITSNCSSLPEVSAGAALEIDPCAIEQIAEAMQCLLNDRDLAQNCIKKGLERAKLLSWAQCVEKTIDVYESIIT